MFFRFDEHLSRPVFDVKAYKASLARKRKKRLLLHLASLRPLTTIKFITTIPTEISFPNLIITSTPFPGQSQDQPGAKALKLHSGNINLGCWSSLPGTILWSLPIRLMSLTIASGNYNNLKITIDCYDNKDELLCTFLFTSSTDLIVPIDTKSPNVSKVIISRNPTSVESLDNEAVGTIIRVGNRPRPPIFQKSLFISDLTYQ